MKQVDLKKKLIKEAAILGGILLCLGGIAYYLAMVEEEDTAANRRLKNEVSQVTNESNALREKYIRVQKDSALYHKILEMSASEKLSISRSTMQTKLSGFAKQHYLNGQLKLSMDSISEMKDAAYKRPTNIIASTTATLNYEALSDEDIYGLIQSMQQELPGSVKITKWAISRESHLTDENIRLITKQGKYPLVKGAMEFTWYGIQPVDAPANPNMPPNMPPKP